MGLSAFATALLNYVGDVIVNTSGRPVPDRVLRYWGSRGLPDDCCTANGVLSATMHDGWSTREFPANVAMRPLPDCPQRPLWAVNVRYIVCWSEPTDWTPAGPPTLDDGTWDADAAMLMDVSDDVARALLRLGCAGISEEPPERLELARTLMGWVWPYGHLRLRSTEPQGPAGMCAGIVWQVLVETLPDPEFS